MFHNGAIDEDGENDDDCIYDKHPPLEPPWACDDDVEHTLLLAHGSVGTDGLDVESVFSA